MYIGFNLCACKSMLLDLLWLTLLLQNASFSDGRLPIVVSKEISGDSSYLKLMSFMDVPFIISC